MILVLAVIATTFAVQSIIAVAADERAVLAYKLLASVHGEARDGDQIDVDAAWTDEIRRRIDEVERGEVQLVSGEESQARVRALLTELHK